MFCDLFKCSIFKTLFVDVEIGELSEIALGLSYLACSITLRYIGHRRDALSDS